MSDEVAMSVSDRLKKAKKERERLDAIIIALEQQIDGRSAQGSSYFFIDDQSVLCATETDHPVDKSRFNNCNYFASKRSAEIVEMICFWHRYLFTMQHRSYGSSWTPENVCWSVLPIIDSPVETHPPFTPENAYFRTRDDAEMVISKMPLRLREWGGKLKEKVK